MTLETALKEAELALELMAQKKTKPEAVQYWRDAKTRIQQLRILMSKGYAHL